jgi:putative ABC transport system permease protein
MSTFFQDLRYGLRMLFKNPGFTFTAIVTLALGIGANTAIFSVINAVLLRPLPYEEPEQLVAVWESDTRRAEQRSTFSYPNFFDLRTRNSSFENASMYYTSSKALTEIETPVNLTAAVVSSEIFSVLKSRPLIGRTFTADEEKPGELVVVLSYTVWQRQFGGDPGVIGRSIKLDDRLHTVIGVMRSGFQFPIQADPVELWVTSALDATPVDGEPPQTDNRGSHYMQVIARLKPGVSIDQARADATVIAKQLEAEYPDENTYKGINVFPFHEDIVEDYSQALWLILGAVGCVLLIACANVANLFLARATVRYKEISIRAALGASRWQIIRQLLTESSLLALSGGALGLLVATWGSDALINLIPRDLPRLSEINVDWWVLGFTLVVSFATGIFFGLAPALQAAKVELTEAMKESARSGVSRHRSRLRNTLVVAEVAIAVVLLVGAGLLLQSFSKLQNVTLGFETKNLLTASISLPDARYPKPHHSAQFYKQVVERIQGLPGIVGASAIVPQPLSGNIFRTSVNFEGRTFAQGETPRTMFRSASLDYFRTMGIGLINGRDFVEQDAEKAKLVAIVNEAFVKAYFPDENPLGKLVQPGVSVDPDTNGKPPWREIVGVVRNVKHMNLNREYDPELYVPHAQVPMWSMGLVIRTAGNPEDLARLVQAEVSAIDRDVPVYDVKTMDQYLGTAVAQPRFNALLLGMFGLLALTLTAIGLYGVIAYSVAQRTREIGIRIALGAQTTSVMTMVVRHGLVLTSIGLLIGVAGAIYLTELLAKMLYNISPTDTMTFLWTGVVLSAVAFIASVVPARRAAKVDPMVALRHE